MSQYAVVNKYPKEFDFVPMGSNKYKLYGKQRTKTMDGIFSVKFGESQHGRKTLGDKSIKITTDLTTRNSLKLHYSGFEDQSERTIKEIFGELQEYYPETELSIHKMTSITAAKKLPSIRNIISTDDIYTPFIKHANNDVNLLIRTGFTNLRNPFSVIKNELSRINKWNPVWGKRLRGTLASNLPFEASELSAISGIKYTKQTPLYNVNQKIELELLHDEIMKTMPNSDLTMDIALPTAQSIIDGQDILPISTYNLKHRHNTQVAIAWDQIPF
jgi:hypothetical protein